MRISRLEIVTLKMKGNIPAEKAPAATPTSRAASKAHLAPSSPAISVPTARATSLTAASIAAAIET